MKRYRWLELLLISFVVAVLSELLYGIKYDGIFANTRGDFTRIVYTGDKLEYVNANINEYGKVVNGSDPQVYVEGIDNYVYSIEIKLQGLETNGLPIQVFCDKGEGFEEHANTCYLENQESVFINIESSVSSIRIDIGTDSDDSYNLNEIIVNPSIGDYLISALTNLSWVRIAFFIPLILLCLFIKADYNAAKLFLFTHRWAIGGIVILFATIMKFNGSSIGCLAEAMGGYDVSRIFGTPRSIRSDEWLLFTEMALSQVKSGFEWFSDIWGYAPSDMYIVYGQPVMNLMTVFRPFSIGYLIGGAEYGLAFFWSARLVILFLISFEFARLFTDDDRMLSLIYTLLVSLSPLVQWWFSINELVEILIFGQLAIVLLHSYMHEKAVVRKVVYVLGIVLCANGYILSLYPAWMIPFFYVFLVCAINVIIDSCKDFELSRKDILLFAFGAVIMIGSLAYIYIRSADTIKLVMGTVYPGQRKYSGGPLDNIMDLFRGYTSYLWTLINNDNPCEKVDFFNLFPMGVILSVFVLKNKKDRWLILLNFLNVVLILYLIFEMPSAIGTITLLDHSSLRLVNAIGFLNLIILIRAIKLITYERRIPGIIMISSLLASVLGFYVCNDQMTSSIRTFVICISIVFTLMVVLYLKNDRKELLAIGAVIIGIIGGGLVNPLNYGLDSIYHSKLMRSINEIETKNSGLWVANGSFVLSNIPTIIGADTLSAAATYPDRQLWEDIGLDDKEEIWNRYAHMDVRISDDTYAEIRQDDLLTLYISLDKLKDLGVDYILSTEDLSQHNAELNSLYNDGSFSIWKVKQDQ